MLIVIASSTNLNAQIVYGQTKAMSARIVYQSWKLTVGGEELNLTQSAFPFNFYLPVADNWEVHLTSAISRSNLDASELTATLTSMSGTSVRVFHSFAEDRVFVSGGIVLPLGQTNLDTVQVLLAELISDDYLTTPVKQVSEGLGFTGQIGVASEANEWLLYGATLSYNLNGPFTYLEDGDKYNPGDEIAIQGSATAQQGDAALDLDLSYRHYMADKVEGTEVFKSGGVLSFVATGRKQFNKAGVALTLAHIMRNKNSVLFGSSLESEDKNSNSDKSVISGTFAYKLSPQVTASLLAGYRTLSANDYESSSTNFFGKSDVVSFGGGLEYAAPDQRYSFFGRLVMNNGEANKDAPKDQIIDVAGTEFSFGGRLRF
ncbi:MAG: hypothetical protein IPH59_09665 [bacterium]|nr:hypothetical protein [bacterium]